MRIDRRQGPASRVNMPEREIQTGIGAVRVAPRVRDVIRRTGGRIGFTSSILPPYLSQSMEACCPGFTKNQLYFSEALVALLGPDAPGLAQHHWS